MLKRFFFPILFAVFALFAGSEAFSEPRECRHIIQSPEDAAAGKNRTLDVAKKTAHTIAVPAVYLWRELRFMEDPRIFSSPLYQGLEDKLPESFSKGLRRFFYYSGNITRKLYNFIGERGLGFPLISLKTRSEIEQERARVVEGESLPKSFQKTYWENIIQFKDKLVVVNPTIKAAKLAWATTTLMAASLFGVQAIGNMAVTAISRPVYVDVNTDVSSALPLAPNQIQIINEVRPMPHTAIRIGDQVFSHGQVMLTQKPAETYLKSNLLDNGSRLPENFLVPKRLQNTMMKMSRTVDVITLNLDPATVLALQNELFKNTQKAYKNVTFSNSCASMVVRVLKDQGYSIQDDWLDASPSMMTTRLALQSLVDRKNKSGEALIANFQTLQYEKGADGETPAMNFLTRQAEIGIQLNLNLAALHLSNRVKMDQEHKGTDDFYITAPARDEMLAKIKAQAEEDLRLYQSYTLWEMAKKNPSMSVESKDLRRELVELLTQSESRLKSVGLTFIDYQQEVFKVELLKAALQER